MGSNPEQAGGDDKLWRHLADATSFALRIHGAQLRKGSSVPYISHLLAVAGLVLEHGGDEEQAIAGLLHDAIEDQGAHQEAAIAERFGPRVARIVKACTDADTVPKPPWRARKEAYLTHLEESDPDVLLVSSADKLHNVRSICTDLRIFGLSVFDRFKGGQQGTIWYYETLSEVFSRRLPGPITTELSRAVDELRRLADYEDVPSPGNSGLHAV